MRVFLAFDTLMIICSAGNGTEAVKCHSQVIQNAKLYFALTQSFSVGSFD